MKMTDIILQKRNGNVLTKEELTFFVNGYIDGSIPDYQASALLMAIYFQGMKMEETVQFTKLVMNSGDIIDLQSIPGIKVDKHSTGGVGDKTTLILLPLVASTGVNIAKLTGKGIGHTGGTVDKLNSFKGVKTELSIELFKNNLKEIGIGLTGQTQNLVPADKKLYALRDVTGTVKNIPLIACSIMSKKLASGSDAIVLDVKCGKGAFMTDENEATALAKEMVAIGKGMDKKVVAVISNMNQPLGNAIGNNLEAIEAIEVLKNNGPEDITKLTLELGVQMMLLSGLYTDRKVAMDVLHRKLISGEALQKQKELIHSLGGEGTEIDNHDLFQKARIIENVTSQSSGYVQHLDARTIGEISMNLGAGRKKKSSPIDLSAGIVLHKKEGDEIKKGELLATLYTNKSDATQQAKQDLIEAYEIGSQKPVPQKLIFNIITDKDV